MLLSAHGFTPEQPVERALTEAAVAADGTPLPPRELGALQQKLQTLQAAAARATADGEATVLRSALQWLCDFLHNELTPRLRASHWLVQESCTAALALGRALDDPGVIARYSLELLSAREAALPIGIPHLAVLYAAHGGALSRLLREGRVPPPARAEVAGQAAAALQAAGRIRTSCLGEQHPLTRATLAALQAAVERRERLVAAATASPADAGEGQSHSGSGSRVTGS